MRTHIAWLAVPDSDGAGSPDPSDPVIFGEHWQLQQLSVIEIATGRITDIQADGNVYDLAWSPDGSRIVYVSSATPDRESRTSSSLHTVAPDGSDNLMIAEIGEVSGLCWPTHERIVHAGPHERDWTSAGTVWSITPGGADHRTVGPTTDDEHCLWALRPVIKTDAVLAVRVDRLVQSIVRLGSDTGKQDQLYVSPGTVIIGEAAMIDGELIMVVLESTAARPVEVVTLVLSPSGEERRAVVSDHGSLLDATEPATVQEFRYAGADGLDLDGVLILPAGDPQYPLPTVVWPHGGPYDVSGPGMNTYPWDPSRLLADRGYAVLLPNYRGGAGRGQRFAAMARTATGGRDFDDVLAAVDAAVERGIADPNRLGLGGWSQGGFLTAWGITRTDRFRAAVIGAGVTDWRSIVMENDAPEFEAQLAGGPPWSDAGRRSGDERSAICFADRVSTPTLVVHGADDERVPVGQGVGFARALRDHQVPVRQVIYPREGHTFTELTHQEHVLAEIVDWFDRWLRA